MKLSIIIVNYNVKYFLEQCLCSVRKAVVEIDAEVIVIDNASGDGSVSYLQPKFSDVRFVSNPENMGFAKANNRGWQMASGEYILFLNPDTVLPEDGLEKCIRFMESHPRAGACGVRMIDGSGRFLPESKRGFPDLPASFYKMSGLAALFPRSRQFSRYYLGHLSEKENQEVDVLSGAFFLTRKEVLQQTGGFDEAFFMYGEDIDLSYRIQKAGFVNYYLAETQIVHYKGESTRKGRLNYVRLFYSAMEIFVRKHFAGRRNTAFRMFTWLAIYGVGSLSAMKLILGRTRKTATAQRVGTLVVGSDRGIREATYILGRHPHPARKITHTPPGGSILEAIATHAANEVIFCEDGLSFKRIIELMQQLPPGISSYIHASGAGSIAGSSSKEGAGHILAG